MAEQKEAGKMNKPNKWDPPISASVAENPSNSSPILFRGPLSDSVRRAAIIGYSCIDLHLSGKSDVSLKGIGKILDSEGIKLAAVATGNIYAKDGLSLSHENEEVVSAAETAIRSVMQDSCRFGAVVIIGIARGSLGKEGTATHSDSYKRLTESVRRLARFAEEIGSTLAIEAICRFDADSINNTDSLLKFLDEVGSPSVMANLDTFHMLRECEDIEAAFVRSAGRIACFHIADTDRKCPSLTGMGLTSILRTLRSTGYEGALTMEYTPCEEGCTREAAICDEDQDLYARKGIEYLKECLSLI